MATSPTQRTLAALKKQGRISGVVERFNRFGGNFGIRQDLFGIIDIISLDKENGVVGVQSTGQAFAAHHKKLTEEKRQECIDWLETPGAHLELWGWRKVKVKRGGKQMVWKPRIKEYTLEDFNNGT